MLLLLIVENKKFMMMGCLYQISWK